MMPSVSETSFLAPWLLCAVRKLDQAQPLRRAERHQTPPVEQVTDTGLHFYSQGDGREPHVRELGIHLGAFSPATGRLRRK